MTTATPHTCPRPLCRPGQPKNTARKKPSPSSGFPLWPLSPLISYFFRNREASTVCFPSSSSESESEDVEPVSQSSSSSESSESSSSSLEKEERLSRKKMGRLTSLPADPSCRDFQEQNKSISMKQHVMSWSGPPTPERSEDLL